MRTVQEQSDHMADTGTPKAWRISRIINLISVLVIVGICIFLIRTTSSQMNQIRNDYLHDISDILEIVIRESSRNGGLGPQLVGYLQTMPGKTIRIYDADLNMVYHLIGEDTFDTNVIPSMVNRFVEEYELGIHYGHSRERVGGVDFEVHYRWIHLEGYDLYGESMCGRRKLLVICGEYEMLFNISFVYLGLWMIVVLVGVIILNYIFFGYLMKARLLNEFQKRTMRGYPFNIH